MSIVDASNAAIGVLLVGFTVAALIDIRTREVDDRIWLAIVLVGGGFQTVVVAAGGTTPLLLWLVVLALVVQHLVPWDDWVGRRFPSVPGLLELGAYVAVGAMLLLAGWQVGIGPSGLPASAIAAYVAVLVARGLFEANLLYGGADAKAVMVAGAVVPFDAMVFLAPHAAVGILSFYPFAITLLMNGALAAVAVPLALFFRNAGHGDWNGIRTFTGFPIPVDELPNRFVWVTDPTFRRDEDVETAEDDRKLRERFRDELQAKGVGAVWVTPQIPFVVLLAVGAVLGVVFGNLLADAFSLL
ncbi:MAG TPA: A24 family peptidase C-terminal domain-containing protein [Thermoplasmata archaeon]|jgi:prepilin signal peptidase PulO-like enzyme (type II secretory pathway)|nr:A24 family peptidase C-terminal domain-containing protein [Thermoplasmata archaeon]